MPDDCTLFDGAMGTYYAEVCSTASRKCELANLLSPSAVLEIHREYVEAGAGAIRTNTFGANTALLEASFGDVARVLEAGWRLALEAAGRRALVFADIGPVPAEPAEAEAECLKIVDVFLDLGADHFVFETFGEAGAVLRAARHIRKRMPKAYVLAQFAVSPDGITRLGVSGAALKRAMETCPDVDAWGFNCVSGPAYLYKYMAGLGPPGKALSAMPNAGYPALSGGRTVYRNNPDYFAGKLRDFRALGATLLGGCCGTTPRHIAAATKMLKETPAPTPATHAARARAVCVQESPPRAENRFWSLLERGGKAVAAEVDPPKDTNADGLLQGAQLLARAGADVLTVADNPLARVRADSSMTSSLLARRCGCEALPHIACRDRNLNAIKSLLLALHIDGVRSVLVVTGDPIARADRSEVKGVYNSNSAMLAGTIRCLNEDLFAASPIAVGAALNVNAPNFDAELKRAERKAAAGVRFFLTQPVFSEGAARNAMVAREALGAKVLAGILPLAGYRNARFLMSEVPGMGIPEETTDRFAGLGRAESERLGLAMAMETARGLLAHVDGYYVITPLGRYRMAEELVRALRREIDADDRRKAQ